MSDLFTDALAFLADSPVASSGTLTPPSGDPVAVVVLGLREQDPDLGFASPGATNPGFTCELLRAAFPTKPVEQSALVITDPALTLRVHAVRVTTYTWALDCYAV